MSPADGHSFQSPITVHSAGPRTQRAARQPGSAPRITATELGNCRMQAESALNHSKSTPQPQSGPQQQQRVQRRYISNKLCVVTQLIRNRTGSAQLFPHQGRCFCLLLIFTGPWGPLLTHLEWLDPPWPTILLTSWLHRVQAGR